MTLTVPAEQLEYAAFAIRFVGPKKKNVKTAEKKVG
jgi:hypothetical protein